MTITPPPCHRKEMVLQGPSEKSGMEFEWAYYCPKCFRVIYYSEWVDRQSRVDAKIDAFNNKGEE